ncbi:MAG TPA: DUF2254 domain-containing protein [Verrucomicrobiae bacterium]|nr:DUF2254 domain-containing protein [Verrucomicrobiae bacterium]
MNQLKQIWSHLRSSFWFLPSLIVAGSIAVALALIHVDAAGSQQWMSRWPRLFGASAAGARGMLSTIAGSMMTVVGVTFSMVLVTLALASSQYTSRILRNFMRDRVTQVVLGVFAGIFSYCLIVLRTIRGGDAAAFIPSVAVTFGVVLAISGIGALIFFIHHIASSIQASSIIASVADETMATIDQLFPEKFGQPPEDGPEDQSTLPLPERSWQAIPAGESGYLQRVENATLLRLAREHHTVVRMERGIGEFVVQNTTLASLALADPPTPKLIAALQAAYSIHRHRTVEQDAAFGIRQLVDMALRALSPGINDTTTAVMCVDYLTTILARLAVRTIPYSHRYEEGELRVITIGPTFGGLVAESFDQIRASAKGNIAVMLRLLDAIEIISGLTASADRRGALREQMEWIAELAERTIESPHDLTRFEKRLASARSALETEPVLSAGAKREKTVSP